MGGASEHRPASSPFDMSVDEGRGALALGAPARQPDCRLSRIDRVPWCGGSEGVTLGVRCVGYAAVSSLVVLVVTSSLVGVSMRAMEPSER